MRVAVADSGGPGEPRVIEDPTAEHGRGLLLVHGLSVRTGVAGDQRGRLVWADIDFGNLHWAAGPGVRVFTPLGAVRADVGFRLNRTGPMEPEPDSKLAFHISIGEAY